MSIKIDETVLNNSQISFEELRKKQSVRATFKLPQDIIDLLGVIAGQLGIKQKSLLDRLFEDASLLCTFFPETNRVPDNKTARRQKTYVISRSSLRSINEAAKKQKISRDAVVEFSIRRLLPVIENELEKHSNRKIIQKEMHEYMKLGENLREKTEKLLGKDDLLHDMLAKQVNLAQRNILTVDSIIEKGKPMENW